MRGLTVVLSLLVSLSAQAAEISVCRGIALKSDLPADYPPNKILGPTTADGPLMCYDGVGPTGPTGEHITNYVGGLQELYAKGWRLIAVHDVNQVIFAWLQRDAPPARK